MNPAALLGLLADLYTQVTTLQQENEALRAQLATPADVGDPHRP